MIDATPEERAIQDKIRAEAGDETWPTVRSLVDRTGVAWDKLEPLLVDMLRYGDLVLVKVDGIQFIATPASYAASQRRSATTEEQP